MPLDAAPPAAPPGAPPVGTFAVSVRALPFALLPSRDASRGTTLLVAAAGAFTAWLWGVAMARCCRGARRQHSQWLCLL